MKAGLTDNQLMNKVDRLSGSTTAGYLGRNPWRSPLEEWEINAGLREFTPTEDTEAGNFMEPSIAAWTLDKLGIDPKDAHKPDSMFHVEHPDKFVVHCDLLVPKEKLGIQIKNHMPFVVKTYKGAPGSAGKWDNNLIPQHLLIQCMVEMEVVRAAFEDTDWDTWILAAYFGGSNLRLYWIKRSPKLAEALIYAGGIFWGRHLDPNGPKTPPTNEHWVGPNKKPPPRQKLTASDLLAAPLPTYT